MPPRDQVVSDRFLSDVSRIFAGLFSWVDIEVAVPAFGAAPTLVASVIDVIDRRLQATLGPAAFTSADFEILGDSHAVRRVLDLFAHQRSPNAGYLTPLATEELDAWTRPFFREGDSFLVLDARVSGNAFIECAAAHMRRVDPDTDRNIGLALETIVRKALEQRSIVSSSGCYRSAGADGECDVVVETERRILLFEVKKKALTHRSRGGHDMALLCDLSQALLEPQIQLGRTEIALYQDDELILSDGTTVTRGIRQIERIALTLFDFGAFHTRDVSVQLLDLLAGAVVNPFNGPTRHITQMNRVCRTLGEQGQLLACLRSMDQPHFDLQRPL